MNDPVSSDHPSHLTPASHFTHPHTGRQDSSILTSSSSLVEMLSKIDSLEVIPKLQVESYTQLPTEVSVVSQMEAITSEQQTTTNVAAVATFDCDEQVVVETEGGGKESRAGYPRAKPVKEKTSKEDKSDWHYHLGGMRHARTPLTPEIKEVLEVAYVSNIIAKSFRREGQPEKERIAKLTGLPLEKVQEWFKNRRKKDKRLKNRRQSKLAAMNQSSADSDYTITTEAVETTEEWFKSRRRSSDSSKVNTSSPIH